MKIKLDEKHYLNSDQYNYWITALVKDKNGKPVERRKSGYMTDLEGAVVSYIDQHIKSSETGDFKALIAEVKELKKQVKKWTTKICSQKKS